jgi:hypothetical protein
MNSGRPQGRKNDACSKLVVHVNFNLYLSSSQMNVASYVTSKRNMITRIYLMKGWKEYTINVYE